MIPIDPETIKNWARMGQRAVYGQTLLDLAEEHPSLIAMSADLGNSSGLDRFKRKYPSRFINVGIAEQNLVGVASGIANEGFNVFASSFAPFITMRAAEQVRMNLGYMQQNVKIVGIGSGLGMGFLGNSHFGLEDIAIIRAIPNIAIITPSDTTEVVKALRALAVYHGPAYLRLTGVPGAAIVNDQDYDFEIGKSIQIGSGDDICLVASGSMVVPAIQVSNLLRQKDLSVAVLNMHTIKPLDELALQKVFKVNKLVVSIEEHSIIGGLGSAIAEFKSVQLNAPPHLRIALKDEFGPTGSYEYLLNYHELSPDEISLKICKFWELNMH
jgi:transketolase